jgi:hypothetical protein
MEITIVDIIQAMLAPGIMISACGLLLLGMNNKYSLIVNRIRLLDDEKRKLSTQPKKGHLDEDEEHRLKSIMMQLTKMNYRIKIVRNAVTSYSTAIALFILSSLFIGLDYLFNTNLITGIAVASFLAGMLSVMIGVLFAAKEVRKGYEIIQIEINEG